MEAAETLVTTFSAVQRILQIWYCLLPALFGLFMILWGVFINGGDWILIGAGLIIFLLFGRGLYLAVAGRADD